MVPHGFVRLSMEGCAAAGVPAHTALDAKRHSEVIDLTALLCPEAQHCHQDADVKLPPEASLKQPEAFTFPPLISSSWQDDVESIGNVFGNWVHAMRDVQVCWRHVELATG